MTLEIGFLFLVLGAMVYLFLTEKLPVDLTAFLGLVILIFAGYVPADKAFDGFASSAVITMLAIFILSAALLNTGVADVVAKRIHRWVGSREIPLLITVMIVAGVLSAFMNNIAATAVLMPAVASLGRQAGLSPSRLFMPLAFGAILGGTTTLVGTPPNILAGAMLEERGLEPFSMFDFTPIGLAMLGIGVLFMVTVGRRLLPDRDPEGDGGGPDLAQLYQLQDQLISIRIPKTSRLDGATLGSTRLGSALGVQIVAVVRDGRTQLAPTAETTLEGDDELLVQGKLEDLRELLRVQGVEVDDPLSRELKQRTAGVEGIAVRLRSSSGLVGKTLRDLAFREKYGPKVVGLERDGQILREHLALERLRAGDELLCIGLENEVSALAEEQQFEVLERGVSALDRLVDHGLFVLELPEGSPMVGHTVAVSRMGELMGLTIVGIVRDERVDLRVTPDVVLQAHDRLLVSGERSRITGLLALGDVMLEAASPTRLESSTVAVAEATIAPRSGAAGSTLAELDFRDRYGLQVLSVWREGEALRDRLHALALRVGDALLLQGPRDRLERLTRDSDYIVLSDLGEPARRLNKAVFAIGGLVLMVALVLFDVPIQVAAFSSASLVVLFGALTMEEAYRAIEWRAIFLVAAVLPVGGAMEESGAASLMARTVMDVAGPLGPYAVLASLIVLSSVLSQGLDGAPAVVLLTPVVLEASTSLGLSPYPFMLGVAVAASAAFMTPFSHKANLLVMGLGGYRSTDYLRVGTPLTVVLLVVMVVMVPFIFPFEP
ncbi:MAG: SLC13 family permease [Acidobacteriota bacterium]